MPTRTLSTSQLANRNHDGVSETIRYDRRMFVNVYEGLRCAARRCTAGKQVELPMEAEGLVHEGFLKLEKSPRVDKSKSLANLNASALRSMRELLVDRTRSRRRHSRGGGIARELDDATSESVASHDFEVIDVHEVQFEFERFDQRKVNGVTMRYFQRMSYAGVAALLDVSVSAVENDLRPSRAWMRTELKNFGPESFAG